MKAAIYRSYGPPEVLKIEEVEQPTIGDGHEDRVLIRVHSASINPYDTLFRKGYWPVRFVNGFRDPKQKILGIDVAGTVEAVGRDVSRLKAGDRVFGNCLGSHAEYVRARQDGISLMPRDLEFHEAAAIPTAALTALQALRDVAMLLKAQKVLINGASGGVGHFALQLARYYEAQVTAVCSTPNLGWVKDLGAGEVIDYSAQDFTRNGQSYDVILDAAAARTAFSCRRSLTPTGIYITENPLKPPLQIAQILLSSLTGNKRIKAAPLTRPSYEDLDFIRELVEQRKLRPVVEKCYPLKEIAAAHRHVENGHTRGKVVIEVR